ncbi:MAG: peptidoglycan-binding protein [Cyanobacteria bacterium J06626_23]
MATTDWVWDDYPILRPGMSGPSVERLQRRLHLQLAEFGSLTPFVPITGRFDPATVASVRYLQCVAFLPVNGIVGIRTWDFLLMGVRSHPILVVGSHGAMIWQIQDTLKRLGLVVKSDGLFGPALAAQLRYYQSLNGVPETGLVERKTWTVLVRDRVRTPRWWLVMRSA